MSVNKKISELAESYLAGTMAPEELDVLTARLRSDSVFAAEFQETLDLLRSMVDSGKHRRFKNMLRDVHQEVIDTPVKQKKNYFIFSGQLWRTVGVAASVAFVASTVTFWSLKPTLNKTESKYNTISREVKGLKIAQAKQIEKQKQLEIDLDKTIKSTPPPSDVKKTGTGFALTNNGYFVTAYHVLHDENGYGDSVYILNNDGQYFKASLVTFDADADVAIMKVDRAGFRFADGDLPYTFSKSKAGLGTHIFTLGYPTDELSYSEGYISSRNGFDGNTLQYTLELPVGHGQSGSPMIDGKGNILGLLTAVGSQKEEKTYAVSAKAITDLLQQLPDEKSIKLPKYPKISRIGREQQIDKIEDFTFVVKVYKK